MPTIRVDGYWSAEKCDIEPCARESFDDLRYYVFVCPFTRDSDRLARTECVGFATREEIAKHILW